MTDFKQLSARVVGRMRDIVLSTPLHRLPGLKRVYDRFRSAATPTERVWIDHHGYEMYVDPQDRIGYQLYRGHWEPEVEQTIREQVPPGGTVVDVGGHFGAYTLQMRRAVGPDGDVVVFEPHPDNVEMLRRTVDRNSFENVVLEERAVADSEGTTELLVVEESSLSSTHEGVDLSEDFEQSTVEVNTVGLGSYLEEQFDTVDFIKMDIQGAEIAAIRGLEAYVENVRSILLEVHDTLSRTQIETIFELLSTHGTLRDVKGRELIRTPGALGDSLHVLWTNESIGEKGAGR